MISKSAALLPHSVLELRHGRNNPRNSEGAFIDLADGRIMFAYTRFQGSSWSDNATACIAARYSSDGGVTWTKRDRILVSNEGGMNVMSVSLLRLSVSRIALFYLRKNSLHDCRLQMRISSDEGKSWSEARNCMPSPGYYVVNNDRVIQLKSGRIVVPAAYHRAYGALNPSDPSSVDWRAVSLFCFSDDAGETWRESSDWWGLPVRNRSGLQEPGVVELKDGSLYAWARTDAGRQWQMVSRSRGNIWSPPYPSKFLSPCSSMSIRRLSATGDLLAVWNDLSTRWKLPKPDLERSWGRTPLALAISRDEGKTWNNRKLVESDPATGYCYTAIYSHGASMLLAYCQGGREGGILQNTRITCVPIAWLYDRTSQLINVDQHA